MKLKKNNLHLGTYYGENVSYLDQEHQRVRDLAGSNSSVCKLGEDFTFPKFS